MNSYARSASALVIPVLVPVLLFLALSIPTSPAYGEVRITSYGSAPIPNGNLYSANHEALQRALLDSIQKFFNARPDIDQPIEINKDFTLFINSYSILNRTISETNTRVIYVTNVYLDDEALLQWNNIVGLSKTYSTLWYDLYINGNRETTSIYEGVGQLLAARLKEAQYYSASKQDEVSGGVDIVNNEGYDQAYDTYANDNEISRLVYSSISLQYDDETQECSIATETSAIYKVGKPARQDRSPATALFQADSLDACINGQLPDVVSDLGTTIASKYYTNNNIHSFQLIIENMKDIVYINNLLLHLTNRRYITESSLRSLSTTNITYTLDTTFDIKYLSTKITQYIKTTPVVAQEPAQEPAQELAPELEQGLAPKTEPNNINNAPIDIATDNNTADTLQADTTNQPSNVAEPYTAKPYNVEMRRTPSYIRLIF